MSIDFDDGEIDIASDADDAGLIIFGLGVGVVVIGIDKRATTVAGTDGRVGLNVDERTIGIRLACDGADDAHGDGVAQTFGTSKSKNEFTLTGAGSGTLEGDGGKIVSIDFDDGEIDVASEADDAGLVIFGLGVGVVLIGIGDRLRVGRDDNVDSLRAVDDVGVGDDVAVGIDDDTGADGAVAFDDGCVLATFGGFGGAVAGDENLDYGGRDAVDESFDGGVELVEGVGRVGGGFGGLG